MTVTADRASGAGAPARRRGRARHGPAAPHRHLQELRRRPRDPQRRHDHPGRAGARARRRERRRQVHDDQDRLRGRGRGHGHDRVRRRGRSRSRSTGDAIALGIATVYQEPQLFAELTVVGEHLHRPRDPPAAAGWTGRSRTPRSWSCSSCSACPPATPRCRSATLSIAEQQQVSIAKALAGDATVLILDEPSAILTDAEIEVLFARRPPAHRRRRRGHLHLAPARRAVPDRRRGHRHARRADDRHLPDRRAVRAADRRADGRRHPLRRAARSATVPDGDRRCWTSTGWAARASSTTSTSRCGAGEIVGLYGLVGSRRLGDRRLRLRHRPGHRRRDAAATASRSPRARRGRRSGCGIALLPANRKVEGMFALPVHRVQHLRRAPASCCRGSACSWTGPASATVATDLIKRLAVKTPHERQPISAMSGGNAQKVVLARQLVERPEVLVLAEPTQGVDVGAKEEIHRIITELADERHRRAGGDLRPARGAAHRRPAAGGARRHHHRRVRAGRHPGRRARRRRRAPSTRRTAA